VTTNSNHGQLVTAALIGIVFYLNQASGEEYALLIGVNQCPEFRLPDGSKSLSLRAAESDAEAMYELLTTRLGVPKQQVTLLTGQNATRAAMQNALQKLARQLQSDDHLWFHFAGHGTQVPDQKPYDEEDDLDEALCLADATTDIKTLVLDDELGRWLEDLPARRITVLLDCCHSGTGLKDVDEDLQSRFLPFPGAPAAEHAKASPWREVRGDTKSVDRDMTAIFACQSGQQAYERRLARGGETIRAGQFTHYLLEGLASGTVDRNADKTISRKELYEFIAQHLDESFNTLRERPSDRQQPVLETDRPALPIFPPRSQHSTTKP